METAPTIDPETSAKYESVIDSVISQQVSPEREEEEGMVEAEVEETKTKLPSSLPESLEEAVTKIKQVGGGWLTWGKLLRVLGIFLLFSGFLPTQGQPHGAV